MLTFTKQERLVLIFTGFIFLFGIGLNYAFKRNPNLHNLVNIVESKKIYSKVDVNRATYQELVDIPYIGPVTAEKIIDYRERHGSFRSVEEVRKLEGIYESNYEKFEGFLEVVEGVSDKR